MNGFDFTNRFANSRRNLPTLFEKTAVELGLRHKLIRPYTPRHNGKVERSHREDQNGFIPAARSIRLRISPNSSLPTTAVPTTFP